MLKIVKMIKIELLPVIAMLVFMGSYIGVVKAQDYYYYASLPGLVNANATFPFCTSDECIYESTADVSIDIDKAVIGASTGYLVTNSVIITNNDASIITWEKSISGNLGLDTGEVDFNESTGAVSISGSDITSSGWSDITFTAKVDGEIVDRVSFQLDVFDTNDDLAFITTWDISNGYTLNIPTDSGYVYEGTVSWGDGTVEVFASAIDLQHTYSDVSLCDGDDGTCVVKINGIFESFGGAYAGEGEGVKSTALKTVDNLGYVGWKTFDEAFFRSSLISFAAGNSDTSSVTNMSNMFYGSYSLISLDLTDVDTFSVTNMSNMFFMDILSGASSLISLDLTGFNTSNVTNMGNMFNGLSSLTSLDLTGFDTSSVANINNMFRGASSLTILDLTGFDTSSVTNMGGLFHGVSGLTSLDVTGFNMASVDVMASMFHSMTSLTSLDLSGWDTSAAKEMQFMFYGASGLTSLDLSNFDTSNVNEMQMMFSAADSLIELDLSHFDTSSVTRISGMFYNAISLTSLNLSGWDTSSVDEMMYILRGSNINYIEYIDVVSSSIYGDLLHILAHDNVVVPSGVAFNRGLNTCGEVSVCQIARSSLAGLNSWTGLIE